MPYFLDRYFLDHCFLDHSRFTPTPKFCRSSVGFGGLILNQMQTEVLNPAGSSADTCPSEMVGKFTARKNEVPATEPGLLQN
jgi:hypothetical protein